MSVNPGAAFGRWASDSSMNSSLLSSLKVRIGPDAVRSSVALVEGEAGIGKTGWSVSCSAAAVAGHVVPAGSCPPIREPYPPVDVAVGTRLPGAAQLDGTVVGVEVS